MGKEARVGQTNFLFVAKQINKEKVIII